MWGQKVLQASAHSIPSPRFTRRKKKCPKTDEGNPYCQNVLPRTTLSSTGQSHRIGRCHVAQDNPLEDHKRDSKPYRVGQNHRIGRCHVAQDNPLEDHKRDSKPYRLAIGAW